MTRAARMPAAPLIGRDLQLRHIDEALLEAPDRVGSTLFIRGLVGMGKTVLAEEALRRARAAGFVVARGRAWQLDAGLAYAPFVEALGSLLRGLDGKTREAVTTGLGELARLFPDVVRSPIESTGDASLDRTRLFEAVVQLIERLSERHPLALLIDDAHLADDATVALLHYIARRALTQAVVYLVTVRDEELSAAPALASVIESLDAAGVGRTVQVTALSRDEVRSLTAAIQDGEPSDALVDLLTERSGGAPLFVASVVRGLARHDLLDRVGGRDYPAERAIHLVPTGVRALFVTRLARLEPSARQVVDLLAIAGEPVSVDLLESAAAVDSATAVDSARLVDTLCQLTESGWAASAVAGFHFAHPMAQEVVYAELSEVARRDGHVAFLSARQRARPRQTGRLARHVRGASTQVPDPAGAIEVLWRAAQDAVLRTAHDEAAQWLSAGLALIRRGHQAERLAAFLESLGSAWFWTAEHDAALEIWREAIDVHRQGDDLGSVARLHGRIAVAASLVKKIDLAQTHLAKGTALADAQPLTDGVKHFYRGAVTLAAQRRDVPAMRSIAGSIRARTDGTTGPMTFYVGLCDAYAAFAQADYLAAIEHGRAAAGVADHVLLVTRAMTLVGEAHRERGEHSKSDEVSDELYSWASVASPMRVAAVRCGYALTQCEAAEMDNAIRSAEQATVEARRIGLSRYKQMAMVVHVYCMLQKGDVTAAETQLRALEPAPKPTALHTFVEQLRAKVELAHGNPTAALARLVALQENDTRLTTIELIVDANAELADADALDVVAAQVGALAPSPRGAVIVDIAQGSALMLRGEPGAAVERLRRAADGYEQMGMALAAARTTLRWIELCDRTDPAALEAMGPCSKALLRVGAPVWVERARAAARRLGLNPTAQRPAQSPLSARELQVARMAAGGLTNAQVAKGLFLSPHTVATHLKKIYARIGVRSRAELRAWMATRGEALD